MPVGRDPTLNHAFATRLREVREAASLSQEELGFRSGLHRTEVGMLERGIRLPRIDTLNRLAGSLGVDPGDLLTTLPRYRPAELLEGGLEPRE